MEKIFEGRTCIAEYIPDKKRIFFNVNGYLDVEEQKKMYLKVFEFMKSNLVVAFMHDLRQMKGTFTNLNDFLVETFRPATELGFRYAALILNDDVFTAFAANDIISKAKVVQIQVFKSISEAEQWLDKRSFD